MSRLKSDTEHLYITTIGDGYDVYLQSNNNTKLVTSDIGVAVTGRLSTTDVYATGNIGYDSSDHFTFTNNTKVDVILNGSNEFMLAANGDFHADGDVVAFSTTTASDENLKENIKTIEDALDKVKQLRGVEFDWKKDGTHSAGVVAQEIEQVLPFAVKEVDGLNGEGKFKTVRYDTLHALLIEAIKEQQKQIDELKLKLS